MITRIVSAALLFSVGFGVASEVYDPGRFGREILVLGNRDALQFKVLTKGNIVFVDFAGGVKCWDSRSKNATTLGRMPTDAKGEVELLGFSVSPDYLKNGHLFALYCPEVKKDTMRVSRFTVKADKMSVASEDILPSWHYDDEHIFHRGGAVFMDGREHLYIGNCDNCHWNPGLPLELRPGNKSWDALRCKSNSQTFGVTSKNLPTVWERP